MVVSLPSGTTQRRTEIKPHRKKVPYLCFNTLWKAEGGGDRGREERERENLTLNLSRRRSSPLNKYYKTNARWIQARLLDDQTHPRTPAPVDRGLTDFAHQTHTPTVPSVKPLGTCTSCNVDAWTVLPAGLEPRSLVLSKREQAFDFAYTFIVV